MFFNLIQNDLNYIQLYTNENAVNIDKNRIFNQLLPFFILLQKFTTDSFYYFTSPKLSYLKNVISSKYCLKVVLPGQDL